MMDFIDYTPAEKTVQFILRGQESRLIRVINHNTSIEKHVTVCENKGIFITPTQIGATYIKHEYLETLFPETTIVTIEPYVNRY